MGNKWKRTQNKRSKRARESWKNPGKSDENIIAKWVAESEEDRIRDQSQSIRQLKLDLKRCRRLDAQRQQEMEEEFKTFNKAARDVEDQYKKLIQEMKVQIKSLQERLEQAGLANPDEFKRDPQDNCKIC